MSKPGVLMLPSRLAKLPMALNQPPICPTAWGICGQQIGELIGGAGEGDLRRRGGGQRGLHLRAAGAEMQLAHMGQQRAIGLLRRQQGGGAERREDRVVGRRDDDRAPLRIDAQGDRGRAIGERLVEAPGRVAGDIGEGAGDAAGLEDVVARLAVDAGLVDHVEGAGETGIAQHMELGSRRRRDLDHQRAVRPLRVIAADRQRADAAAGRDGAAVDVGDIAADGAVARERSVGADGDGAGEAGGRVVGIADLQRAGVDRGDGRYSC